MIFFQLQLFLLICRFFLAFDYPNSFNSKQSWASSSSMKIEKHRASLATNIRLRSSTFLAITDSLHLVHSLPNISFTRWILSTFWHSESCGIPPLTPASRTPYQSHLKVDTVTRFSWFTNLLSYPFLDRHFQPLFFLMLSKDIHSLPTWRLEWSDQIHWRWISPPEWANSPSAGI